MKSNLATCEKLDVKAKSDKWINTAPMNMVRHALSIVTASDEELNTNYIYAIGGWMYGTVGSGHVERYNIDTDTWKICASMEIPRRLFGASYCEFDKKIYIFGGNVDDKEWNTGSVECYNPITDNWSKKNDLPFPGQTSVASVGKSKYLYVFLQGKCVYRYNTELDTYEKLGDLPLKEWFAFDVSVQGSKVFIHGGITLGDWSKSMFSYDTKTDKWTAMPDMLRQRRRCAAALLIA
jgi:N-acetylneuraminic acid mutarotase